MKHHTKKKNEGILVVYTAEERRKAMRRASVGKHQPEPPNDGLPAITEAQWIAAEMAALEPEDPVPPGYVSVCDLQDMLKTQGGAFGRKVRRMVKAGTLNRISLRRYGIDGHIKLFGFYRLTKGPNSSATTAPKAISPEWHRGRRRSRRRNGRPLAR